MEGLEFVRIYLDNLLCLSNGHFNEHLEDIEKVSVRFQKSNLKVSASKSSFGKNEIEYLGYVVTRNGIKLQQQRLRSYKRLRDHQL